MRRKRDAHSCPSSARCDAFASPLSRGRGWPAPVETKPLSQTAIGEAFRAAGYKTPEERGDAILAEAWRKWPSVNGGGARRDFVMTRLCDEAGEVVLALFKRWQPSTMGLFIGTVLNAAKPERDAGKPADGGQEKTDTHNGLAPVQSRDTGCVSVGGGQGIADTHMTVAPANLSRDDARLTAERRSEPANEHATSRQRSPDAPNLTQLAIKHRDATQATVATMVRLSKLDTVMVWDRKIGDCTVADVREWAKHRQFEMRSAGRDAQFALSLIANLPSGAVIRDWYKDLKEVDKMYAAAEAEHAA